MGENGGKEMGEMKKKNKKNGKTPLAKPAEDQTLTFVITGHQTYAQSGLVTTWFSAENRVVTNPETA